jgi:hypothetical protein
MHAPKKGSAESCETGGYCNNCPGLSALENGDPLKPSQILYDLDRSILKAADGFRAAEEK